LYKNILVPLDGSQLAECVMPHVESIVTAFGPETVTIVQEVEHFLPTPKGEEQMPIDPQQYKRAEEAIIAAAEKYLKGMAAKAKLGTATAKTKVLLGHPADKIADYAKDNKIDAIVMSTHGRTGISRWAMGSVADRLLHIAPVPVLVVRAPGCAVKV
jgi:nucleotide-binding universal stress UspA family protein